MSGQFCASIYFSRKARPRKVQITMPTVVAALVTAPNNQKQLFLFLRSFEWLCCVQDSNILIGERHQIRATEHSEQDQISNLRTIVTHVSCEIGLVAT